MYEDYFGLKRPPFKITPDTSLFYEGGKRGDILAALVYAVHRGEGIVKVVGEVGSGKTMICRMLQLKLPQSVEIVYIANPSISPEDILFVIAHELSLPVGKGASKHEVMHMLQDYLLQRHMENKQVVLFIEEAQGMPLETLEEIRLLSNLETDQNKLLQIILFGQPELDQNLAQQSIRQLRERITHNFNLLPLSAEEIHLYLNFRMREVGFTGPELISFSVAKKVEQYSGGLLRRINIIADKILLSAFAEGTHDLGLKHVIAASNDSNFGEITAHKPKRLLWLGLLLIIAVVFAVTQARTQWISALASELSAKPLNAAIIDKPVTDIAPRSVEDISPVMVETGPETVPVIEIAEQLETDAGDDLAPVEMNAEIGSATAETGVIAGSTEEPPLAVNEVDLQSETAVSEDDDVPLAEAMSQTASNQGLTTRTSVDFSLTVDHDQWLNAKLRESLEWLSQADGDGVSIQVLMRNKVAVKDLVYFLRNEWPLDISKTYLYEVDIEDFSIYRVFYSEFSSLSVGRDQIDLLPDSVKVNSPYLQSVYRMQKALL